MVLFRLDKCKEAFEDANQALAINPVSSKAIVARGEALYSMGEFEKGLVQFQKGLKIRMDSKMKNGMQKCKIVIENAVGPNAKQFEVDLVEKVVKEMEKMKNAPKLDRAALEAARIQESYKSEKKRRLERLRREQRRKKMDRLLLGQVAVDASFLRVLAGVDGQGEQGEVSEYQVEMLLLSVMMILYYSRMQSW